MGVPLRGGLLALGLWTSLQLFSSHLVGTDSSGCGKITLITSDTGQVFEFNSPHTVGGPCFVFIPPRDYTCGSSTCSESNQCACELTCMPEIGTISNSIIACVCPQTCLDNGTEDPHFVLPTLYALNLEVAQAANVKEFAFDFHGLPNKAYCMITDTQFAVNAHMYALSPDTTILENKRLDQDGLAFFEGTWMDGIGFVYKGRDHKNHSIAVWLNRSADVDQHAPFDILVDEEAINLFEGPWISLDGTAAVQVSKEKDATVIVAIDGLIEMEISRDFEEELVTDPPVQFIAITIRAMSTTPDVHGFLGQMYAPNAAQARLEMGTLDGFRHREYVEGADEDYETSGLMSADCALGTFGKAGKGATMLTDNSRRLLTREPNPNLIPCATNIRGQKGVFICN